MNAEKKLYYRIYLAGIPALYTWGSVEALNPGTRVEVMFRGRRRIGLLVDVSDEVPDFKVQPIITVLDEAFVPPYCLEVAQHIADTTMCSIGKVLSLMIPEAFMRKRNPEKRDIVYRLGAGGLALRELKGEGNEEVETQSFASVRGSKQKEVLYLLEKGEQTEEAVRAVASAATVKALLDKELIEREERGLRRIRTPKAMKDLYTLTDAQKIAHDVIVDSDKPALLWGVTGSGKTELYRHLAREVLEKDEKGQVLFLVPEIALTDQFIASFQEMFGEDLAVWHSKMSVGERTQEWLRVTTGDARILIGARSACMVPLRHPSLLIVDEEHEWTYKNEFAPRFWTRDVVLQIANSKWLMANEKNIKPQAISHKPQAKTVFGSATPSLWALAQVEKGDFVMTRLKERVHSDLLPEIRLVDIKKEMTKGNYSAISEELEKKLRSTLDNKRQAVLFLNKRGLAGSVQCQSCGEFRECPNCSYSLKLHERNGHSLLICHVCGHMKHFKEKCPDCEEERAVFKGWGTQQVEIQLKEMFPEARIARADRDTITGKHDFTHMYNDMKDQKIDILLGTQMVAKGLDFAHVDLVGVLLADVGLGLPDYMAEERAFQLLTQVAGRAGRSGQASEILVQTFKPEEPLFQALKKYDIDGYYDLLKAERKLSLMPPYGDLIKMTFTAITKEEASEKAKKCHDFLKRGAQSLELGVEVFMAPAFFPRMHGKYHWHVFVQSSEKTVQSSKSKGQGLMDNELLEFVKSIPVELLGKVDVNPVSLL